VEVKVTVHDDRFDETSSNEIIDILPPPPRVKLGKMRYPFRRKGAERKDPERLTKTYPEPRALVLGKHPGDPLVQTTRV